MENQQTFCISCSMPLGKKEEIGAIVDQGSLCIHCVHADGTPKSCKEVFAGGVEFFLLNIPGTTQDLAERITRKNMKALPYWQGIQDDCLLGAEATDEEFATILSRL